MVSTVVPIEAIRIYLLDRILCNPDQLFRGRAHVFQYCEVTLPKFLLTDMERARVVNHFPVKSNSKLFFFAHVMIP
jgi:hypothetical protein